MLPNLILYLPYECTLSGHIRLSRNMRIRICTNTGTNTKEAVLAAFDRRLFLTLAPPFPKVTLTRFDGCIKGDEVHMELHFGLFKQIWIAEITESGNTATECYFIDEGKQVPAPLKKWRHRHIIRQKNTQVEIEDHIEYTSGFFLLDLLLFPPLFFLFAYRIPIYKKYFRKK